MSKSIVREQNSLARVLEYTPRKFDIGVAAPAMEFHEQQRQKRSDFNMSEPLRIQTGLKTLEQQDINDSVEQKTLEKLQEVQEGAYQAAYELGLEEGKKEAFTKASAQIDQSLKRFEGLVNNIDRLKDELLKQNETHLLKLVLHIATRIAHHEVQVNNGCVLDIMRKALADAQIDEEVTVQVSAEQFEFLENLKKQTGREYEYLKKVKLLPVAEVSVGGCIIETNYGVIDARIDERIGKLWETMAEGLYRVKDKIGAA